MNAQEMTTRSLIITDSDKLDTEPNTTTTFEGEPFNGLAIEILINGKVVNDLFYNGLLWKPCRIWTPSGQLIEEWWLFDVDSFHGINQTGSLDMELEIKEEFWKGVRVGFEEWDGNGNLIHSEKNDNFGIGENRVFRRILDRILSKRRKSTGIVANE